MLENAAAGAALDLLERRGIPAGIVLQVDTPVAAVARFLPRLRFLTLLGTAIGVKGQGLDARAPARLGEAQGAHRRERGGRRIVLAADGGIREHTVPVLRAAGAETVVLGSLAFAAPDLGAAHGVAPRASEMTEPLAIGVDLGGHAAPRRARRRRRPGGGAHRARHRGAGRARRRPRPDRRGGGARCREAGAGPHPRRRGLGARAARHPAGASRCACRPSPASPTSPSPQPSAGGSALPVRLENDGIAAALGEWRFGAGRGHANLVYVTLSTGIGGGVVADGRVLRGRMGLAGHVGHMTIVRDGAPCPCGNRGCWEAYASGTAFAARASQRLGRPVTAAAVFDGRGRRRRARPRARGRGGRPRRHRPRQPPPSLQPRGRHPRRRPREPVRRPPPRHRRPPRASPPCRRSATCRCCLRRSAATPAWSGAGILVLDPSA